MDELGQANELIGQEKYAEAERAFTAIRTKKVSESVQAKTSNNPESRFVFKKTPRFHQSL